MRRSVRCAFALLEAEMPGYFDAFLKWIDDPTGNIFQTTVVSIVETIRDDLMAQRSIARDTFINA